MPTTNPVNTHVLEGIPPLNDDCMIVAALRRAVPPPQRAGLACRLGIPGPTGRVYRVVECDLALERNALLLALHRLGFTAEPSEIGMTLITRPARQAV